MDSSSGMKRRGGWTWKTWLGIALGVAVLVAVILIAANAGSGSGGIYWSAPVLLDRRTRSDPGWTFWQPRE